MTLIRGQRLLEVVVNAAVQAGEIIRNVHKSGVLGVVEKSGGMDLFAGRQAADPQTEADRRAEKFILDALYKKWPALNVVGEESSEAGLQEGEGSKSPRGPGFEPLVESWKFPSELVFPPPLVHIPVNRISVWVDPLDGTVEFTEGNLQNVTTLVGVAVDGHPAFGVIAKPFPNEKEESPQPPLCMWGLVGCGSFFWNGSVNTALQPRSPPALNRIVVGTTRSKAHPIIDLVCAELKPRFVVREGGAGRKFWDIATGRIDLYLFPRPGTKKWDSCAGEAIVKAMGGWVTDSCGHPLQYSSSDPGSYPNSTGMIVTNGGYDFHLDCMPSVLKCVAAHEQSKSWPIVRPLASEASDIACLPSGHPLSAQNLSDLLGRKVRAFSAPEKGAVRYRLSQAARIYVEFEGDKEKPHHDLENSGQGGRSRSRSRSRGGADKGHSSKHKQSFYYKRIVPRDLPDFRRRAGQRLRDTVFSLCVESHFYKNFAKQLEHEKVLRTPEIFYQHQNFVSHNPLDSSFCFLMEDFSPEKGFEQHHFLEGRKLDLAIEALASFHATFWGDQGGGDLWETGSFWAQRPPADAEKMRETMKNFKAQRPSEFEKLGGDVEVCKLLEKLEKFENPLDTIEKLTLVHGDFKSANLLFSGSESSVGLVDFQWVGRGHPAWDLVYFILASVHETQLEEDEKIVEKYHTSLMKKLKKTEFSLERCLSEYRKCFVEFAKRSVLGEAWLRFGCDFERRKGYLGAAGYNKSTPHALFMLEKVKRILEKETSKL